VLNVRTRVVVRILTQSNRGQYSFSIPEEARTGGPPNKEEATVARTALLASVLAALPTISSSDIEWAPYYQEAMRNAEARGAVVFVAVNMDGESSNEEMVKAVYRDKRVVELSRHTINLVASTGEHSSGACKLFGSLTCENHMRIEGAVRGEVVKYNGDGRLVAPQHVFLDPHGEVLLSVPYGLSADELVWCFCTAISSADPESPISVPTDICPPRRLIMKDVCNSGVFLGFVCPLTEDELDETITELRSGWGAIDGMEDFNRILSTDHPDAIKFATTELGSGVTAYSSEVTSSMIRTVGRFSPPSFWEALEPCLEHHGRDVRCERIGGDQVRRERFLGR